MEGFNFQTEEQINLAKYQGVFSFLGDMLEKETDENNRTRILNAIENLKSGNKIMAGFVLEKYRQNLLEKERKEKPDGIASSEEQDIRRLLEDLER